MDTCIQSITVHLRSLALNISQEPVYGTSYRVLSVALDTMGLSVVSFSDVSRHWLSKEKVDGF